MGWRPAVVAVLTLASSGCDKLFSIDAIRLPADASATGDTRARDDAPDDELPCFMPPVQVIGVSGYDPTMRNDRLEIVYAKGATGTYKLYHATRTAVNASFVEAELAELNSSAEQADPNLTADGLMIVFRSNRSGQQRAYQATRTTTMLPFGTPALAPGLENQYVGSLDLSPDGTKLYFNNGGALAVVSRANRSGTFQGATDIAVTQMGFPSVSPDGTELLSNGAGLLYSRRSSPSEMFTSTPLVLDDGASDGDFLADNSAIIHGAGPLFYTRERCP